MPRKKKDDVGSMQLSLLDAADHLRAAAGTCLCLLCSTAREVFGKRLPPQTIVVTKYTITKKEE
jgi:hypothetical protein